jgi:hypothetical protein
MAHKDTFKLHRFNPSRNNVRKQFFYNTGYEQNENNNNIGESMYSIKIIFFFHGVPPYQKKKKIFFFIFFFL